MKNIFKSILVIFAVLIVVSGSTSALFTAQSEIEDNYIQTGTLKLKFDELKNKPVRITNMAPGESTSGSFAVQNNGTLPQEQYFYVNNLVKDPDTEVLVDNLTFEIKRLKASQYDCEKSENYPIYKGSLKGIVGTTNAVKISDKSSLATNSAIDSEKDNIDPGVWGGKLCQKITLSEEAPNGAQGASLTFDEIVYASQDHDPDIKP